MTLTLVHDAAMRRDFSVTVHRERDADKSQSCAEIVAWSVVCSGAGRDDAGAGSRTRENENVSSKILDLGWVGSFRPFGSLRGARLVARTASALLVLFVAPACGDGSSSDSPGSLECTAFTACGGDLLGTWKVGSACLSDATRKAFGEQLKLCAAGMADVTAVKADGTATFEASGASKYVVAIQLSVSSSFPSSCLAAGEDCAAVQKAFAAKDGVTNAACSKTATGCSCSYMQKIDDKSEDSFVKSGTTFTETDPSDGSMTTTSYCVQGNTLHTSDDDGIVVYTR
jgi:hypothetical protein